MLVGSVVVGFLVAAGEKIAEISGLSLEQAACGERIERAGLEGGGAAWIAGAAGGFHPEHAADGFAAVDGTLRAAQDFDRADIISAAAGKQVAQRAVGIAEAHAVDDDLGVRRFGATDE